MGRKRGENYVDNARLRELIIEYNDLNPGDDGKWLDRYEKKMTKAGKYAAVRPWIALRRQKYAAPRKYTPEFQKVSEELFNMIDKIIRHRLTCFTIPAELLDDLIQECLLTILSYINRYREDLNSSAFAYVTQLINNTVKLYMGRETDSMWCRCPMSDIAPENNKRYYGDTEEIGTL